MKYLRFKNNKGEQILLHPKLTIDDLVRMGFRDIELVPKEKKVPLKKNWWRHKS